LLSLAFALKVKKKMKFKKSPLAPAATPVLPPIEGVKIATGCIGFYGERDDLLVASFVPGTSVAGVFTKSSTCSADVDWCREALAQGKGVARALVVNAGNSNAFTGAAGVAKNQATIARVVELAGCDKSEIFLAATGVIGEPVEPNLVADKVADVWPQLGANSINEAGSAFMTTDTFPKAAMQEAKVGDDTVQIAGIAKGSGMIAPNMATMLSYIFTDEYDDVPEPTEDLDDCSGVAGTISAGWWTFHWGANKNPLITDAAIIPMLERLNTDFAYFREIMGWPPDLRALNGYRSAVYLYGSGLCTDNASNTDLGGWQSAIYHNGQNWPMILASYYPVYSFDPACTYSDKAAQQGAMVHEGIHCVLASLPGCKNAAWFHEGGNTWLQQEADSRRSGDYSSMGFLNAAAVIAHFMPIEC
jgi:hypothetical protein